MKRREFITLRRGAALAWPLAAQGQQPAMPVIGLLGGGSPELFVPNFAGFRQGLQEAGVVEGRNAAIEARWARGRLDQLPGFAARPRRPPGGGDRSLPDAPRCTGGEGRDVNDPDRVRHRRGPGRGGSRPHASTRPGGNITGLSNFMNLLVAQTDGASDRDRAECNRASRSSSTRTIPNAEPDTRKPTGGSAGARAPHRGAVKAAREPDLETAFSTIAEQRLGALFVNIDFFLTAHAGHTRCAGGAPPRSGDLSLA